LESFLQKLFYGKLGEPMIKRLPLFIFLLFISQAYSIAGFGINLNQTMYSVDSEDNSIDNVGSYGYEKISGGIGFGGYFYIDAIPFIDLDLELNGFGTTYDYYIIINGGKTNYSLPFGSLSGYLTMKKKIFQLKIPLLAKAKFTAGAGINHQIYQSVPNPSDLEVLIGAELTGSSSVPTADALIEFVKDNTDSVTGFHIQTGLQFKLLMLDSFIYYRYVFVEDMIPGAGEFGSLNLRIGMGF
jgi:hypothetical protein